MSRRLPLLVLLLLPLLTCTAAQASPAAVAPLPAGAACASPAQKIDEERFVRIGGIDQWVTIKGERCGNPVLVFVHGGPGSPNTPYATAVYGAWEKDFTLVQWDQRGAGRTYGRNKPADDTPLTIGQMTSDGIAVAGYAAQRLGQRQVILTGSSWGSALAVHMLAARPALFSAYVGVAQLVNARANQQATYERVLALAKAAGDADAVAKLEALGAPPWTNPRGFGVLRRIDRTYEAKSTDPAPAAWWVAAPGYATAQAMADTEAGDDYSYLQFVGAKGDGMFSGIDLPALGTRFAMPVFLVQGEQDLLTMPAITRRWFDAIAAPEKAFVLVPRAGHDPNQALVDAQFKVLEERVLPWLRSRKDGG